MSITPKDQSLALIKRAQKILCLSQSQARTDGVAAILAFAEFAKACGKEVVAVLPHGVGKNLQFLPGQQNITQDLGEPGDFVISLSTEKSDVDHVKYTIEENSVDILITPKNGNFSAKDVSFKHNSAQFDLIILFDCPSLDDLGSVFTNHTDLFASNPTLSISAEPATQEFAKVNLVDPSRSSSCEILFDCLNSDPEYQTQITPAIATSLLTGMIANTGSFLRPNTTALSLEAAALLQSLGAEQSSIIEHLFKQKSFNTLKVWGKIFSTLEVDPTHRIAWAYITQSDLAQVEARAVDVDSISDEILRYTENVDLAALIIEKNGETLVQVRSKNKSLDWSCLPTKANAKDVENGVDLHLTEKNAIAATETILSTLVNWQKQRLNISEEIEPQLLSTSPSAPTPEPLKSIKKAAPVPPTPPAEVPFLAPKKESQSVTPKEHTPIPGTQAAEFIVDTDQKGIPDWLKKSFPKN